MRTKPRLTHREIEAQIFKRSGIPMEFIHMVLSLWDEIVEEGLYGGMEVPVGQYGFLTWKQIQPKKDVAIWSMAKQCYSEPQDTPGYCKANFRFSSKWKQKLKEITRFELGEANPMLFGEEDESQESEKDVDDEIEENEDGE